MKHIFFLNKITFIGAKLRAISKKVLQFEVCLLKKSSSIKQFFFHLLDNSV
jgi:hypothetical protein